MLLVEEYAVTLKGVCISHVQEPASISAASTLQQCSEPTDHSMLSTARASQTLEQSKVECDEALRQAIITASAVQVDLEASMAEQAKMAEEWESARSGLVSKIEGLGSDLSAKSTECEQLGFELESLRTAHEALGLGQLAGLKAENCKLQAQLEAMAIAKNASKISPHMQGTLIDPLDNNFEKAWRGAEHAGPALYNIGQPDPAPSEYEHSQICNEQAQFCRSLQDELEVVKQTNAALERKSAQAIATLEQELSILKHEAKQSTEQIVKQSLASASDTRSYTESNEAYAQVVTALQQEVAQLKSEAAAARRMLQAANENISEHEDAVQMVRFKKTQLTLLDSLQRQLTQSRSEATSLELQKTELQQHSNSLQQELATARSASYLAKHAQSVSYLAKSASHEPRSLVETLQAKVRGRSYMF